jgi:hypothetical protein
MIDKKNPIRLVIKKGIKLLKNISGNTFFRASKPLFKTIAAIAVLGAVGALELNHISIRHAIIQSIPALIILGM